MGYGFDNLTVLRVRGSLEVVICWVKVLGRVEDSNRRGQVGPSAVTRAISLDSLRGVAGNFTDGAWEEVGWGNTGPRDPALRDEGLLV